MVLNATSQQWPLVVGEEPMDNFKIIYKILHILEQALDLDEFDRELISAEALGISENRCKVILGMLMDEGYIEGAVALRSIAAAA